MSMIGNIVRIPEGVFDSLHRNPEQITNLLYPEMPMIAAQGKKTILGWLFRPKERKSEIRPVTDWSLPEGNMIDIDKALHGLHFIFTGSDWSGDFPEGFLVSCGKAVGDVDVGYGPARSFNSAEVEQIATFLEAQDEAILKTRFDPKKMAELDIYPSIWANSRDINQEWEYLVNALRRMKCFFRETASKNMALLVYLN